MSSKTTVPTPKKKGRPPKQPINIASNDKTNSNPDNVIPPSKIIRLIPKPTVDTEIFRVHAQCSQKQLESFLKLIDVIHGISKEEPCIFIFNESGISIQHKDKNDDLIFDCRLFGEIMDSYHCSEPLAMKLDQGTVLKFLKNFKGKNPFSIFIYKDNSCDCEIGFETYNDETNVRRTYNMNYTPVDYTEFISNISGLSEDNFDVIVILDSSFFMKECKDMKGLSQKFEIFCNNSEFQVNFNKDNVNYNGIQGASNSMSFSKKLSENTMSVNKELSTIEVHDYIKCEGFSNMVKFYLSNKETIITIIEFDIDPEFGVFQAYL